MTRKQYGRAVRSYRSKARISYGDITVERFVEVVKGIGSEPTEGEKARVCQGLTECHPRPIAGPSAAELAAELEMTLAELEARSVALCYMPLGFNAIGYMTFEEQGAWIKANRK